MKTPKKSHLHYAALKAAEFFRDELRFGSLLPNQRRKIESLNKLCWHVLGEISLKDAVTIDGKFEQANPPSHKQKGRKK